MQRRPIAKSFRILIFASVIFGAGILCAALSAQTEKPANSASISGEVTNMEGKPVPGAHVFLQPSDGRGPHVVKADANGHYLFHGLYQGMYDLRAQHQGRASAWLRNLNVKTGAHMTVNFELKAVPPPQQPAAPAPSAAQNSSHQ